MRPLLLNPTSTSLDSKERLWTIFVKLWKTNEAARYHLMAYWCFSFVVVCFDEALPLFLITSQDTTGLGLSAGQIGAVLSTAGFIVAISHHAALERLFDIEHGSKNSMYRILSICAIFGNVTVVLVPITVLLNGGPNADEGGLLLGLTLPAFVFLVALIISVRSAIGLYFSFIGVAFGQTLKVVHKDEAARIMTIGALFVRSWAPLVAGAVVSVFMSESYLMTNDNVSPALAPPVESVLSSSWMVWIVIGLVFGMIASLMTFILARYSGEGVLTAKQRAYLMARMKEMSSARSSTVDFWHDRHDSSKSICFSWFNAIFHAEKERKPTVFPSSVPTSNTKNEGDNKHVKSSKRITWTSHIVAPGVDFDSIPFFILGTHKKDISCAPHVLTPPIMNALQKHLPENVAQSNFWLRYSLIRDGANMHTLEAKAGLAKYTIMAIETLSGDVFGCFMNKVRQMNPNLLWWKCNPCVLLVSIIHTVSFDDILNYKD